MDELMETVIREGLGGGLRVDDDAQRNEHGLVKLIGAKPARNGLVPYAPVARPLGDLEITWPFPQLFRGRGGTFLFNGTQVSTVSESTWAASLETTYDVYDETTIREISGGASWHFADFGDVWFAANGVDTVLKSNRRGMFSGTDNILTQDEITMQTCAAFRGRGLAGGFNPANFWRGGWQSFWRQWGGAGNLGLNLDMPIGNNVVAWSSVGGGDLFWLFYPDLAFVGPLYEADHDRDSRPLIFDYLERQEMGFIWMPWQGWVRRILPLGNGVMVYGDGGVTYLRHYSEPVSTFGIVELADIGIASRSAANGDERGHAFVDAAGFLWVIDQKAEARRLGYQEFFRPMLGQDIIVTKNVEENEFIIATADRAFVLTETGLAEAPETITSLITVLGETGGVASNLQAWTLELETDTMDWQTRLAKLVHSIEVGATVPDGIKVAVDYRIDHGAQFQRSQWFTPDEKGHVMPMINGVEFRIVVSADRIGDLKIDYIKVWWRAGGKNDIRNLL